MLTRHFSRLSLAASGVALTLCSVPAKADDLSEMRQEMQAMQRQYQAALTKLQHDYEAKLQSMEKRLDAAESKATTATQKADDAQKAAQAAQTASEASAQTAAAAPPAPDAAAGGNAPSSANSFNPAIGAVLDGKGMVSTHNPNTWRLPGFALGDEAKPPPRGPSIGESEINLQANVDQALFANLTVAFQNDNSVNIEEAFIQPTALPWDFTAKSGRFFSGVGYLNEQHAHTWDFADAPLPYMAFLNGQYGDDGVQLRWLAPTNMFIELGGEAMRGASFPANSVSEALTSNHNAGLGAWSAFLHVGDDINDCIELQRRRLLSRHALEQPGDRSGRRPARLGPVHRRRPYLHRRRGLQMGAARQFRAELCEAAKRGFRAQRIRRLHRARFRERPGRRDDALVQFRHPDWLLRAGGLSVHPVLARRRALRPSSCAVAWQRLCRHDDRFARSDAAALLGDDRLLDQRVRPLPPAI